MRDWILPDLDLRWFGGQPTPPRRCKTRWEWMMGWRCPCWPSGKGWVGSCFQRCLRLLLDGELAGSVHMGGSVLTTKKCARNTVRLPKFTKEPPAQKHGVAFVTWSLVGVPSSRSMVVSPEFGGVLFIVQVTKERRRTSASHGTGQSAERQSCP